MRQIRLLLTIMILASCGGNQEEETYDPDIAPPPPAPAISYSIVNQYPHDTSAYTQGLEWHNGKLYESTGDYENSSLRITDLKTGKPEKLNKMGKADLFGEGITIFKGKIFQLTWQNKMVFVYDEKDISKSIKTFQWPREGWGITHNEKELIISDGSANLYFVDPETFRVNNTIAVTENGNAVGNLNELEFINGSVFANIYLSNDIIRIDPESGHVTGRMNFANLLSPNEVVSGRTDVLNGIAWDSAGKRVFITGKRWPRMFELNFN